MCNKIKHYIDVVINEHGNVSFDLDGFAPCRLSLKFHEISTMRCMSNIENPVMIIAAIWFHG